MRFSIFTPTHNDAFLGELYASLLAQTFTDWEWVLSPNNGAKIPEFSDPRVRIVVSADQSGVGALKKFACECCRGEYLAEVDHDDILTDDCLEKVDAAIKATNADFLYSDAAEFRADGSSNVYDKCWGWEHEPFSYHGKTYTVNKAFPLTARSLCEIFYAPNHVRVWRADTYRAVGGHDPSLDICDDFDLVIRTYLDGAKFHYIPECLYLYRIRGDGENTWLKRNSDIQKKQQEISNKYVYQLIAEWCRREGLRMLDLGGGINKAPGFKSVDLHDADVICDIRKGLPFEESSVGCVRAADFLEHVPHCADSRCTHTYEGCTVSVMNEIYRVLVPGGWLLTRTPSTDGRGAWMDPTHVSGWSVPNSFFYHCRAEQQQFVPGIKTRFQLTRAWNEHPTPWHKLHEIVYGCADLVALKGQRCAGFVEI